MVHRILFGVLFFVLAIPVIAQAGAPRPNVLVILTDDVGWGDLRCYNRAGKIPTPNIDALARGGMRFTDAHTPAALCAPTRYSMLTGNYAWRGRAAGGTWGFNVPSQMKPGQLTVAQMLKAGGYRTAMFGKAGIGGYWADAGTSRPKQTLAPIEWGFDYSYLIPRGHQSKPHAFYENGVAVGEVEGRGVNTRAVDWDHSKVGERLLNKAMAFLDDWEARNARGEAQPFFMHFCTDGAHGPFHPAETLAGEPLKGVTKMTDHTDMVHETDILTGKLVESLRRRGVLNNTLVIYTSDNGGIPYERRFGHDAVAGLRGMKSTIFEGGQRVPFIAYWPGTVEAGAVRDQVVGAHDVVATALELAGVDVPEGQAIDSVSLAPVLLGQRDDRNPVREHLLVQSSPGRGPTNDYGFRANQSGPDVADKAKKDRVLGFALYEDDWKLVFAGDADEPAALYNLTEDLAEEHNLIDRPEHKDRIERMSAVYWGVRRGQ